MGQRLIISEEERCRINKMYGLVNEQNNTETISQMLQGKEFPDLTKQVEGNDVFYSLIDPVTKRRRLWYITFHMTQDKAVKVSIVASDPKYFKLIKNMFNSIEKFGDNQDWLGWQDDPEYPSGEIRSKLDKQEVNQIFDTLVKSYKSNKNTIPKQ